MCGIAGILDFKARGVDGADLNRMAEALAHRGPDESGVWVNGSVGFAHTRLSILDVAGGKQPWGSLDGKAWITYNGEIYNFKALRDELSALGHTFRTRCDTEVVLASYLEWGEAGLTRLNGIFAFAIWDERRKSLLLARDPLGVKPLYYVQTEDRLVFASEMKAILSDHSVPREVDPASLGSYLTFRYVPSPDCMLRGFRKLPPGCQLVASAEKGVEERRYWKSVPRPEKVDEEEAADRYETLLRDAVSRQLMADVPVGLYLSGGVDSALLLALATEAADKPIRTYTVGFGADAAEDETEAARETADHFGAQHTEVIVDQVDYEQFLADVTWHLEEPIGTTSTVPFYFVSEVASESVKVALTGQGADEPWAGYTRHVGERIAGRLVSVPGWAREMMSQSADRIPGRGETLRRGLRSLAFSDPADRFPAGYAVFSEAEKATLLRSELGTIAPRDIVSPYLADVQHLDSLAQMLYLDTRTWLPDDLLLYGDKLAMAHSVEARVPYLDLEVLPFIESLPTDLKMRGISGKYLHKQVARRLLPASIVERKKLGFASPMDLWLKEGLGAFARQALTDRESATQEFFKPEQINALLQAHSEGRRSYQRQIYALLAFEIWYQTFCRR